MRTKKLQPVSGATVRLLHDFQTRGGKVFRAGLTMRIVGTDGRYYLQVWVRSKSFCITVHKKDAYFYFEVIAVPKPEEDDE